MALVFARQGTIDEIGSETADWIGIDLASHSFIIHRDTFHRLQKARDVIEGAFDCEAIDLDHVARAACFSPFHFHRMFRKTFHKTPYEMIAELRLRKAKEMLERDHLSVTEVCFSLGYRSLGSFSTWFRKRTGLSPLEYRRQLQRIWVIPLAPFRRVVPSCFVARFGW